MHVVMYVNGVCIVCLALFVVVVCRDREYDAPMANL